MHPWQKPHHSLKFNLLLLCQMCDINSFSRGNAFQIGATHYHEELGLPDKGCSIKAVSVLADLS